MQPDMEWWERGACRGHPRPEIFDDKTNRGRPPTRVGRMRRDPYAEARALCASCPVRRQCLEYILTVPQDQVLNVDLFTAGLEPWQIRKLRKRRRAS